MKKGEHLHRNWLFGGKEKEKTYTETDFWCLVQKIAVLSLRSMEMFCIVPVSSNTKKLNAST